MNLFYKESKSNIFFSWGAGGRWLVGGAGVSEFFTMNPNFNFFFEGGRGGGGGGVLE